MNYQVFHACEWLYPDSEITDSGMRSISISAARGSRASCQLLLQSLPDGASIQWEYRSNQASPSENNWIQIEIYQMIDVLVNENTGPKYSTIPIGTPAEYVTRPAPFRVYDALQSVGHEFLAHSHTEAIYVCWNIPTSMDPGIYQGDFIVKVGEELTSIAVSLEVFPATLPQQETLETTNWLSNKNVAQYHGLEEWSEEHWTMLRQYGEAMRRTRQTHFLVGLELITIQEEDGQYLFEFSRVKRYIELFLGLGFRWIEAGHIAGRTEWDAPYFVLSYKQDIQATKSEGYAFLSQFLPAWYAFLQQNDWLELTIQHVADEPILESATDFRVLSSIVRKFMPGIPLIEAMIYPEIEGSIDIWVPTNEGYDQHREHFERLAQLGETVWFYTCWNPGGHYLNRFLDVSLLKTRYLHWGNYKYGLKGYLHWGFNQYLDNQNPFELTCPYLAPGVHAKRVPSGDTHIVYPGSDGPMLSMRLEAMRAGVEDYELFQLLATHNQPLADEILNSCMKSFTEVNVDITTFHQAHRRLLESLSRYGYKDSSLEVREL
ncbi:DUF4091 domain-containing protein [Paenibacillus sp. SYP-B3998]|uniref:DUF4091 domain-containing protein n=1 Tax=Paenibacillus sp. SYP-B3998 TaxID=2678564 RepID=A0A6G3ZRS8_9BACL|nr:DUF4091 domain-containing protein [Paenibacillus sp. SYP-B3998]NEW04760.1 DUF4091 domain-containing protein [Paenibacillus sp. SYP-B3998]